MGQTVGDSFFILPKGLQNAVRPHVEVTGAFTTDADHIPATSRAIDLEFRWIQRETKVDAIWTAGFEFRVREA